MIRLVAALGCILLFLYSSGQEVKDTTGKGRVGPKVDTIRGIPFFLRRDTATSVGSDSAKKIRVGAADTIPKRFERWRNNNIFQWLRNAVTKGSPDSATMAAALNTKSESPFKPYQGKIIRHIYIRGYGFEQTFTDTGRRLQYFGTKALNHLHRKTRDWVIRNSLFIKENTAVNPFKLADNERLIRNLNFIQDARILVSSLPDNPDSVDLVVVFKDLFSINGAIGSLGFPPFSIRGNISEANFLGMGQRVQVGSNVEQRRSPSFGGELLYTKYNIAGTFINVTGALTQIRNDLYPSSPDERAWYIRMDRPLYAPYAKIAGGLLIGNFQDFNVYNNADSVFWKYKYHTYDGWIGWNVGSHRFLNNTSVRDRRFASVRYFRNDFDSIPYQVGKNFNWRFNSREAALGSFTFFRQDFYKTNYVYGFGTTEDLPIGYNVAVTSGWYRQLYLNRWYTGVDANDYVVTKKGGFIQYFLRAGMFLYRGQIQDASTLAGASYYSPLFLFGGLKARQYINFSFSREYNRIGIDPLTINNVFGLRYFTGDSTFGEQRVTLHSETTVFLNYRLLGFKFAPFAFGDLSFLTPESGTFQKSALYHGIGAGMRTRNENLVFNTIEFRMVYFPRKTEQNNSFKIMINTGLQFRFNTSYVHQPDVVFLNTDGLNSIY